MKYLVLFIFFFSQYFYSQQFRDVTIISDLNGFFANNGVAVADYDQDGDGFGLALPCLTFDLTDSYGDGWNGNSIEVYEGSTLS